MKQQALSTKQHRAERVVDMVQFMVPMELPVPLVLMEPLVLILAENQR